MSDPMAITFKDRLEAQAARLEFAKLAKEHVVDLVDSALLVTKVTADKLLEQMERFEGVVLRTSLPRAFEQELRSALSHAA